MGAAKNTRHAATCRGAGYWNAAQAVVMIATGDDRLATRATAYGRAALSKLGPAFYLACSELESACKSFAPSFSGNEERGIQVLAVPSDGSDGPLEVIEPADLLGLRLRLADNALAFCTSRSVEFKNLHFDRSAIVRLAALKRQMARDEHFRRIAEIEALSKINWCSLGDTVRLMMAFSDSEGMQLAAICDVDTVNRHSLPKNLVWIYGVELAASTHGRAMKIWARAKANLLHRLQAGEVKAFGEGGEIRPDEWSDVATLDGKNLNIWGSSLGNHEKIRVGPLNSANLPERKSPPPSAELDKIYVEIVAPMLLSAPAEEAFLRKHYNVKRWVARELRARLAHRRSGRPALQSHNPRREPRHGEDAGPLL
ncbi:hypothetical protein [Xanthobacter sp. 91]|uniref:hypothetical protein n=1 Tax=Xanthobacter sp. 91 TaxID=1117244 RepID=UPI0012DDB2F5|nr:hypothetical protein [Xanthobacter sp. 91]